MSLIAKQGRNQQGLCFVSAYEPDYEPGVYEIGFSGHRMLVDIRRSRAVSRSMIILDNRVFVSLCCNDGSAVSIKRIKYDLPICREVELTVASTKALDNTAVADAVSNRVNDLRQDFDGLLLTKDQIITIDRLGIQFTVSSLSPKDDEYLSCRLRWIELEKIHLEPAKELPMHNLICVIELGAAAHVTDIIQSSANGDSFFVPRYSAAIELLSQVAILYPGYSEGAQFSGIVYSDEVAIYPMFDSETGNLIEASSLYSKSVLESFKDWTRKVASTHRNKPSNPGAALSTAMEQAFGFSGSNDFPTVVMLFSSGMHSSGPNPLKVLKRKTEKKDVLLLCFCLGEDSNKDVLKAITEHAKGVAIEITHMNQVNRVNEWLVELFQSRG